VLAARATMKAAVLAYGLALAGLLAAAALGWSDGWRLMITLNALLAAVAVVLTVALGPLGRRWLPWRVMALSLACLLAVAALAWRVGPAMASLGFWPGLVAAGFAGLLVMGSSWCGSADLRAALTR
jgi:putative peptidoglycan lipid II flippase